MFKIRLLTCSANSDSDIIADVDRDTLVEAGLISHAVCYCARMWWHSTTYHTIPYHTMPYHTIHASWPSLVERIQPWPDRASDSSIRARGREQLTSAACDHALCDRGAPATRDTGSVLAALWWWCSQSHRQLPAFVEASPGETRGAFRFTIK